MSETEIQTTPELPIAPAAVAEAAPEAAQEATHTPAEISAETSAEIAATEQAAPEATAPSPGLGGEKPASPPQNKRSKRGQNRKTTPGGKDVSGKEAGKKGKSKDKGRDKNQDPSWVSYQPADIIKRMQNKRSIWDAYMEDAGALSLQIRQWGLGASLAILLAQTQSKRKRRLYWDLSKWMLKERKLKGKNSRSLIESVLYGDAFYLLRATEASLGFLEEILFLGQQKAYQPMIGKESGKEGLNPQENAPETVADSASDQPKMEVSSESEVETTVEVEAPLEVENHSEVEDTTDISAAPAVEIEAESGAETTPETTPEATPDQNDETRSAPVHA
ncbi:MAG: hypothetical protein IV090_09000 [Candidatus Sericytochromatia bacterium]|nr:hypothetical protein [Candidatus Sericytochromatia bacterium]